MPWAKRLEEFKEILEKRLREDDFTASVTMQKNGDQYIFTTFDKNGVKQYIVFETPMRTLGYQRIK